ncbi:MAG: S-layer homology domain-containing protein, partial [Clostridiales bacterium]|nr:S-layer homology domain-containing protein [Clostridiales bacterium]
ALVSDYAKDALTALVKGGVVSGDNGNLNPEGETTRAQMVQVLYNLLSK